MIKRMIASSRQQLRNLHQSHPRLVIYDGMPVGKRHSLLIRRGGTLSVRRQANNLIVTLPDGADVSDEDVVHTCRDHIIKALRREAKEYLPKRLASLAAEHGHEYYSVRFSHASGRWGSCNSKGVISLNIALMNLPYELIDYVILHELAHTKQMNHSVMFWQTLEAMDSDYKRHRAEIKRHSPSI